MGFLDLFRNIKKDIHNKTYQTIDENFNSTNIKDVEIEFLKKLSGYLVDSDYPKYWNDYINDTN